jgi:multidrug efflux pump subunit AcrA (membrane-fusion protein)
LTLTRAKAATNQARADDLFAQVRELQARAAGILLRAERSGDLRTALTAIREARSNLELLARLAGELREGQVFAIQVLVPQVVDVLAGVLDTPALERVATHLQALSAQEERWIPDAR